MSNPVFLFIESNTSGTGEIFFRKIHELRIQPILLAADPLRYRFFMPELEVVKIDTFSEKALLDACENIRKQNKVLGIASSSEYFVGIAAKLAKYFNLPGPDPDAISLCRNKEKQRLKMFRAGIGVPAYQKAARVTEAAAFVGKVGFPVVLKPVAGSGSIGVRLCRNLAEVTQHAELLLKRTVNECGLCQTNEILVEQYIDGDEYSVETFGQEIVGITKKHLGTEPYFVETGHDFPAFISTATRLAIAETVLKSLKILNLNWGPAHTEVRLNSEGVFVIEVNPRLAGGFIPELVRYSSGIDLIAETINLFLGRPTCLMPQRQFFSSIRFILSGTSGILAKVEGLKKARQLPGIEEVSMYRKPGEKVSSFGDFRDRIGHVISTGESAQEVCETAEKAYLFIRPVINFDDN